MMPTSLRMREVEDVVVVDVVEVDVVDVVAVPLHRVLLRGPDELSQLFSLMMRDLCLLCGGLEREALNTLTSLNDETRILLTGNFSFNLIHISISI